MQILITGGTGFIGRRLVAKLLAEGHRISVLTRQDSKTVRKLLSNDIKPVKSLTAVNPSIAYDAVINLAGEGVMEERWSHKRKRTLLDSRVGLTSELIDLLERMENRPKILISASAIGFYGCSEDPFTCNESSSAGTDFAASLCARWEQAAQRAESLGVKVCRVRIGVVLHPDGGALHELLPAFRLGAGGPLGSGRQMMSWVHMDDLVNSLVFLLNHEAAQGVYNATAPTPVSNKEFARTLGRTLRRPSLLKMPGFVLKMALGESSDMLLKGQAVIPERLQEAGFKFEHPELEGALKNLLGK